MGKGNIFSLFNKDDYWLKPFYINIHLCMYIYWTYVYLYIYTYVYPNSSAPSISWVLKNWCFWTVVLEKILESHFKSKESKLVNPKGNQPWILIGWTNTEAETSILWPRDVKSQLTGKAPDVGKTESKKRRLFFLDGMIDSTDTSLSKLQETLKDRKACAAVHGVAKSWTWLRDWITTKYIYIYIYKYIPKHNYLYYLKQF